MRDTKLFKAFATVGGLTLLSRIAGFFRDWLTARYLGAGPVADAFFIALRFPNFFRRLFAEGSFSVSFIPLFSSRLESDGLAQAQQFAEEVLAFMVAFLIPFTMVILITMPWIMGLLASGYAKGSEQYNLAVELTSITFPYLMMVSVVALLGGILNSLERFGPFAAAPILFNACMAAALLWLTPYVATAGHAMAYGVVISGVLQVIWLFWSVKRAGLNLRLRLPRLTPGVKRVLVLMGPGIFAGGITQINLFVDMSIATHLENGSVSFLYYADRLNQLPLGILGIAVGSALLPLLARALKAGRDTEATHLFSRSLEISLFLGLPAAVALVLAAKPIMFSLFHGGAFSLHDAANSAYALMAFAAGLPAYLIIKVASTAFFAREDTKTPVKISMASAIANIVLSLTFAHFLEPYGIGHVGIAASTAFVSWMQVYLMLRVLKQRGHYGVDESYTTRWPRIVISALGMGLVVGLLAQLMHDSFLIEGTKRLLALCVIMGVGGLTYFVLAIVLKAIDLKQMLSYLVRKETAQSLPETGS